MSGRNKEMKEIVRDLTRAGYSVVLNGGSHYKVMTPEGNYIVSLPVTPGGGRSLANTRALLKRKGLLGARQGAANRS
jgi:predicted RNA binding protein YcfA (HicA-like mRNA interferase family)